MKMIKQLILAGMLMWAVTFVHAFTVADLMMSEMQLDACSDQAKAPNSEVRAAIQAQQFETALDRLGEPEGLSGPEQKYLFGKVHYLLAYENVKNRTTVAADDAHLKLARKYIDLAAKQGFAEAIYDQAILFTPPNEEQNKINLLKFAADKKFIPAMLMLAEIMFLKAKTFEDRIEAQSLILQAANLDAAAKIRLASYYLHEDSQLNNVTGYDKDINKAIQFLYSATAKCNSNAAYKLYQMSKSKHKPNDLPASRAIYWLEISAKLNSVKAQGELAAYYHTNDSHDKANLWALRAAQHNDIKALLTLGKMYYQGKGLDKDLPKALGYYEQAYQVDQTNRLVQNQLGIMYYRGEGAEVDFRRAADMCKLAANKGQAGCQYYLGLMYVNGEGVTQDIDTGIDWMKKSAAQDFNIAKNWLRENW